MSPRLGAGRRRHSSSGTGRSRRRRKDGRAAKPGPRRSPRRSGSAHRESSRSSIARSAAAFAAAREGRVHRQEDQTLPVPTLGRSPRGRCSCSASAIVTKGASAAEVRSFAAKAARTANAEKADAVARPPERDRLGAPHRRGGARARRVPLHEVPHGRSQAEGRRSREVDVVASRQGSKPNAKARARARPEHRRRREPLARPQQRAAERHVPAGARRRPRRRSAKDHKLKVDRLRLQGDSRSAA